MPANKGALNWSRFDHDLARLKLEDLANEMRKAIAAEESEIQSNNRGNLNDTSILSQLFEMHLRMTGEWVQLAYGVYLDIWKLQGGTKTAEVIQALRPKLLPLSSREHNRTHRLFGQECGEECGAILSRPLPFPGGLGSRRRRARLANVYGTPRRGP
jgi:hypothetical protein